MPIITVDQIKKMCKGNPSTSQQKNMSSFVASVNKYGHSFGMDKLYNLSSFMGQVMVESGEFKYDREIWGPTAAQKRYEGRKDLGNIYKGDGALFKGRGPIQLTGRHNVTKLYEWCLTNYTALGAPRPPDFTKNPERILTDPWEGLSSLWYWGYGNPEGNSLNKYATENNQLMVTKRVNGGTTHYLRRLEYQARAALVLLGYGTSTADIRTFQSRHPAAGTVDGIVGDKTRTALHLAMKGHLPVTTKETVTVTKRVPVRVDDLDKPWYKDIEGVTQVGGGTLMTTIVSFLTNADTQKIIVIAAIALSVFAVWYLIRKSKAQKQEVKSQLLDSTTVDVELETRV